MHNILFNTWKFSTVMIKLTLISTCCPLINTRKHTRSKERNFMDIKAQGRHRYRISIYIYIYIIASLLSLAGCKNTLNFMVLICTAPAEAQTCVSSTISGYFCLLCYHFLTRCPLVAFRCGVHEKGQSSL